MTYPPLASFMPHRRPMLLLDALVRHDPVSVEVEKTFRDGDLFVVDGHVDALVTLELFAQAAAAHFGYSGLLAGGAFASGALLGTRRIDLDVPRFPVGQRLVVRATQTLTMPPIAQYDCELVNASAAGEPVLARGSINVALGPPPPT